MKKFLSVILSIILILTIIPAFQVAAAKEPTFVVSNAKADVGDNVKITISTQNNPGIISMQFLINYDNNALKLVSAKEDKFKGVTFGPMTKVPFIATWIDPLKPNNDTNGVVVTLEFEVLDTAPNGKSEISVTYDPENVFEFNTSAKDNFKNVDFAVKNGYVDIKNPDGPKKPVSSQESSSDSAQSSGASVDEETNEIYEQIINDMLNDGSNTQSDSTDKNTNNTISDETIITDGNTNVESDNETNDSNDNIEPQNKWLIWIVIAAIVVLGGAFVVVIAKGKKSKH